MISAERRARLKQLFEEGRVENDAIRKRRKAEAKRQVELEAKAEMILVGLNPQSKPKVSVTETVARSEAPTEATRTLANGVKYDKLASAADQILKELQAA